MKGSHDQGETHEVRQAFTLPIDVYIKRADFRVTANSNVRNYHGQSKVSGLWLFQS